MSTGIRTDNSSKFAPGKLTPELKRKVRKLSAKGLPGYEIARRIRVSPNAVYRFLRRDAELQTAQER